jgi:hypothetical protein
MYALKTDGTHAYAAGTNTGYRYAAGTGIEVSELLKIFFSSPSFVGKTSSLIGTLQSPH